MWRYLRLIAFCAGIMASVGCDGRELIAPAPSPPHPARVDAGADVWLPLPADSLVLSGFATSPLAITSYSWKKVSGPASYSIESPESQRTKMTNLEEGTYEFELAVTDKSAWTGRDSVSVSVYDPRVGANEFIFRNVPWTCPMGCSATVNFQFSAITPTSVLVKGNAEEWIEAKPEAQWKPGDRYVYGVGNSRLWIYADDEQGAVDIRIIF